MKRPRYAKKMPEVVVDKDGIHLKDINEKNVHLHMKDEPTGNEKPLVRVAPRERGEDGKFAPGSVSPQAAGGLAKKGKSTFAVRLTLEDPEKTDMAKYYASGETYRKALLREIRELFGVGGGAVSGVVADAAEAMLWNRYYTDQAMLCKSKTDRTKWSLMAIKYASAQKDCITTAWKLAELEAEKTPTDEGSTLDQVRKSANNQPEDEEDDEYEDDEAGDPEEGTGTDHAAG